MNYKKYLYKLFPKSQQLRIIYYNLLLNNKIDPNIKYIKKFTRNKGRAIDIGVNIGIFSYFLANNFEIVESFEPLDFMTKKLKDYSYFKKNINIYNVALSNNNSVSDFYIPYLISTNQLNYGLSSLIDPGGKREVIKIELKNLDSYNFKKVDFIKIDVEGSEYSVLKGAFNTITNNKPTILIEIEQRHLINTSIAEIIDYILSFGYDGFFIENEQIIEIKNFNYELHQKPYLNNIYSKLYINNFWFKPI